MRWFPDSIAGRITGLLIVGLIVTAAASSSVYLLDLFHGKGWDDTARNLQHIAAITAIMDRAPVAVRRQWAPLLNEQGLTVAWSADQRPPQLQHDAMTRHLARDVRVFARVLQSARVLAGYAGKTAADGWIPAAAGIVEVWVELTDHSWLHFSIANRIIGGLWTLRLVLAVGLLFAGIAALGVWAARRVTAPLARFSQAAEALGANMDAKPMSETGPREIRQAAAAFNGMQARIRRLVEDRTLMLAALSHDLRTALTRLRFRTDFIGDLDQRHKAELDLDELQTMLDAALSFSRDEAAVEAVASVDLAMLAQSLCDDLSDAGKPVVYHGPAHLNGRLRPVAMRRVLANLIDNALKYGQQAEVRLRELGSALELTVADRGPGIPEAWLQQVFTPFFRLERSRNRETGGTGLGLTVAQTIVHRHGGNITLENRPDGGLRVRVLLPVATFDSA